MEKEDIIEKFVDTKYNDMRGLLSIDSHSGSDLAVEFLSDHNIDPKKYFLLGIGINEHFIQGFKMKDHISCTVLLLDHEKYGMNYDKIEETIKKLDSVDVIKKSFSINPSILSKYIKRISCMAVGEMIKNINKINIID